MVIKLPADATDNDHFQLLGLLNSSTACFWFKQVFYCKGAGGVNEGSKEETWERFYEHDGTKIRAFPIPFSNRTLDQDDIVRPPDFFARRIGTVTHDHIADVCDDSVPSATSLEHAGERHAEASLEMIALQEELDWQCYRFYGLLDEDLCYPSDNVPPVKLGERTFEIVLARRLVAGEVETKWFERHGSTPITEIPTHWPEDYRRLVQRRIQAIASNPNVALIEQPEYKRRWNTEPWEEQQTRSLRAWLLDRLEDARYWREPRLTSCARLADRVRDDAEFMQVAELYRNRADFDLTKLVIQLVEDEGMPFLPVLRYGEAGLRKRHTWEECWALQRKEDAGETVGEIPVPPKYVAADFRKSSYWRLRGKLDVPKERFILYLSAERDADRTPVLGWAGWDALQQAEAQAAYFNDMKESEAWAADRLAPLLAGLVELLPWLRQWHNDLDPKTSVRMGDYYAEFVDEEARALGLTIEALRGWRPAAATTGRRQRRRP